MIPRFWRRRERVRGGTILPERHFPSRAGPGGRSTRVRCGPRDVRSPRGAQPAIRAIRTGRPPSARLRQPPHGVHDGARRRGGAPRRSSSTSRDAMPVARLNRAKSMRALAVTAPRRLRRASRSPPAGESRATGSPLSVISKVSPACTRRRIEAVLSRSSRCAMVDTAITS